MRNWLKYLPIIVKLGALFEAIERAERGEKVPVKGVRLPWKGVTYVLDGEVRRER